MRLRVSRKAPRVDSAIAGKLRRQRLRFDRIGYMARGLRLGRFCFPEIDTGGLLRNVQGADIRERVQIDYFHCARIRADSFDGDEGVAVVWRYYRAVNYFSLGRDAREFFAGLGDRIRRPIVRACWWQSGGRPWSWRGCRRRCRRESGATISKRLRPPRR